MIEIWRSTTGTVELDLGGLKMGPVHPLCIRCAELDGN